MPLLPTDPLAATIVALVVGLCVGSFLNVVVHRLPRMLEREWAAQCAELAGETPPAAQTYNLWTPRSACPACGHPIGALDNIPLASWLVLRGKCRACAAPISSRYPLVELGGGLLAAVAIWHFGPTWQGAAACALLWTLLALAVIDADTQLLPDNLTLPSCGAVSSPTSSASSCRSPTR
jgi:leader peptidase (prepilin peptidase)/N-methyltransferase